MVPSCGTADEPIAELLPLVYDELRGLAESYLRNERADHTLEPTALVHETFLRLRERTDLRWHSRSHFYRIAARTMRRILVNHAIRHSRVKRGGGRQKVNLDVADSCQCDRHPDLIDLDHALTRFSSIDEQKSLIVEMRFFAGCTIPQIADALGISTATVEREWRTARAWLHSEMTR